MLRFGQILGLRPQKLAEYRRRHAAVWPEVASAIHAAGFRNYSIFHRDGLLFGYFEFDGTRQEFDERMRQLATAPRMREWWDLMEAMQEPVKTAAKDVWWAPMEEVFHLD